MLQWTCGLLLPERFFGLRLQIKAMYVPVFLQKILILFYPQKTLKKGINNPSKSPLKTLYLHYLNLSSSVEHYVRKYNR